MNSRRPTPRRLLCTTLLAVIIAIWGAPRRSAASVVGTIFSSPTTGDPASVYLNPAAMTLTSGTQTLLFGALSAIRLSWQPDTLSPLDHRPNPDADVFIPKPTPALGVVTDATLKDFRFGLSFSMPVLDGAAWDERYHGRPSPTRYYAVSARLAFFYLSAASAYRINRYISVGVGLDVIGVWLEHEAMTDFGAKINQLTCAANNNANCPLNAPLSREDPRYDARTSLSGVGWSAGVFGGVLISPTSWLRIGGAVHSGGFTVTVPANLSVQLPGSVTSFVKSNLPTVKLPELQAKGDVEVTSPWSATAGVAVQAHRRVQLAADLHYLDYSSTGEIVGTITRTTSKLIADQVLIKARRDSFLVGLRGNVQILEGLVTALRVEFEPNTRPDVFVSPISPDFHRLSFHLGGAWQATSWLALTLEYGHYFLFSRTITESRFAPNASATTPEEQGLDKPSPTGRYLAAADRVGLGVLLGF